MKQVIVFDIGGTNSRIALVEQGRIVERAEARTLSAEGPRAVIKTMADLFRPYRILDAPVGVALTGQIVEGRVTAHNPAIMPGWHDFPFRDEAAAALGRPIALANDARAAAWGEFILGAGRGVSEFLFLTVSTGVGGGLVLGGKLHLARNGFDAEIGEAKTADGETLENHASGSALAKLATENGYGNGRLLCDAADEGDSRAEDLYRLGIREIAGKLADLAVMLGIQRAAVGGGLGLRPGYVRRLREELARYPAIYRMDVVPAELGQDAGLHGMAALASSPAGIGP